MTKFAGKIGYGEQVEVAPGEYEQVITERPVRGEVLRNSRRLAADDKINNDLSVGNSISIVADAYSREHFFAMQYVWWAGVRWIVSNVDVDHPRLVLRLGGVYHGPTVSDAGNP